MALTPKSNSPIASLVPWLSAIREFTQTEKEEQEIAEACNRLIKNSIICWNYLYLARQVEKAPDINARENLLRLIKVHSPASWGHITCSKNMISRKKSSVIPSTSCRPKKYRSERAKTGRKNIVKTAVDQITSTIPVADFEPLCRRTQVTECSIRVIACNYNVGVATIDRIKRTVTPT